MCLEDWIQSNPWKNGIVANTRNQGKEETNKDLELVRSNMLCCEADRELTLRRDKWRSRTYKAKPWQIYGIDFDGDDDNKNAYKNQSLGVFSYKLTKINGFH